MSAFLDFIGWDFDKARVMANLRGLKEPSADVLGLFREAWPRLKKLLVFFVTFCFTWLLTGLFVGAIIGFLIAFAVAFGLFPSACDRCGNMDCCHQRYE